MGTAAPTRAAIRPLAQGLNDTGKIALAVAGTTYFYFRKMAFGVLAGLLACSVVGGIGYRAVLLPNQSWILSTEAALSALKEVCAFPEGTSAWERSGCEGRAPKG